MRVEWQIIFAGPLSRALQIQAVRTHLLEAICGSDSFVSTGSLCLCSQRLALRLCGSVNLPVQGLHMELEAL